ncbi:unnamed protein product [Protopolystoma xenopodis]|uniref:Uncharacterized protein n=1 Tax=Protopolystoma xenopodis TaxID=117903 RepID=A0A448XNZ9_9PLAT|nr:unnamed protein product [Protopolystoma xenopodis]
MTDSRLSELATTHVHSDLLHAHRAVNAPCISIAGPSPDQHTSLDSTGLRATGDRLEAAKPGDRFPPSRDPTFEASSKSAQSSPSMPAVSRLVMCLAVGLPVDNLIPSVQHLRHITRAAQQTAGLLAQLRYRLARLAQTAATITADRLETDMPERQTSHGKGRPRERNRRLKGQKSADFISVDLPKNVSMSIY